MSAKNKDSPNLRAEPFTSPEVITSLQRQQPEHEDATSQTQQEHSSKDVSLTSSSSNRIPVIDPENLVGRIFLLNKEDGQRLRNSIVKALDDFDGNLARDPSRLKIVCSMNDETIEEIFTYNESLDHINNSEEDDLIEWKFKEITAHEGPLPRTHPKYNGSPCNLAIEW